MIRQENRMVGGILLISGTTIGAAILALPVVTGFAGFFPTFCLFLLYWAYMTYTALLLLEVNLAVGGKPNLVSMVHATLGRWGEVVSWTAYLLLLYLLTAAYLAGSSPVVAHFITSITGWSPPIWISSFPMIVLIGFFVFEGTRYVDYFNRLLMAGLVIGYLALIALLLPQINPTQLLHAAPLKLVVGLSLVATSFGYHIIIPTLTNYMHRDVKRLRKAILIGSTIPLIIYLIWELVALGTLPLPSLATGYREGQTGVQLLVKAVGNGKIALIAQFFSFFSIVTSFLGVSKSLMDFLSDGLKIKQTFLGRTRLTLLTLTPPFLIMLTYPRAFIAALEYAGAYGVVILLGLMPPLMAWAKRYRTKLHSPYTVSGGRPALLTAICFSICVIAVELAINLGYLEVP